MNLISLRDLARERGMNHQRLLRQLEILEADRALCGVPILVRAKGKIYVKAHILEHIQTRELAAINDRLDGVEARTAILEFRVDTLEAG